MAEAFNVNRYWLKRGQSYFQEAFPEKYHRLQERFLTKLLQNSRIPMGNVLELGCGFGRITRRLSEAFPDSKITALDFSPHQLENARQTCEMHRNISFRRFDFYSDQPIPGSGYDTAIAVEVFLHHPRPVVRSVVEKLAGIATHVVNLDWSEDWPWETAEHVWVHDFASIYSDAGLRCRVFPLPEKIDSMQQKLFIASRKLSPALTRLERQVRGTRKKTSVASTPASHSEKAHWPAQLALAVADLRKTLKAGTAFILVNDDQWGNEERDLGEYRIFPFLEHRGKYWGPPADDRTAIRQLQRLQGAGATHIAFAWCSFWWLDYYTEFRQHLRSRCVTVLQNDRLIVFELASAFSGKNIRTKNHA